VLVKSEQYVQRDGDAYSLWIRQTTSTTNVRIVAAEPAVMLLARRSPLMRRRSTSCISRWMR
jgi:hypothetical protein